MRAKSFLLLALLAALLLTAFTPWIQTDPGDGLSPELVVILSAVIIPALVQVLKFIGASFHVVWKDNVVMAICFGISVVVAVIWIKPIWPSFPVLSEDPELSIQFIFDFLASLLTIGSSIFGLATLIYRWVLKAIFKALGMGNDQVKALAG